MIKVDVLREEYRLLKAQVFDVTTTTVTEEIEALPKQSDIVTRACTPCLRFTADPRTNFTASNADLGGISCQRCG